MPSFLDELGSVDRQAVMQMIALAVQQNGGAVNGNVIPAVREQLLRRWQVQYADADVLRAIEVTVAAMQPPQPPSSAAAHAVAAPAPTQAATHPAASTTAAASGSAASTTLDPEAQVGLLFSWLHAYSVVAATNHNGSSAHLPPAPPDLDEKICHALQAVLAMGHNRALARRVHAQARTFAGALPAGSHEQQAAARAQGLVEAVYNVIVGQSPTSAYSALPPLQASGRAALLAALDKVGVYARDDPFPPVQTVPCERRTGCRLMDANNQPVRAANGSFSFDVLRPTTSKEGGGSGGGGGGEEKSSLGGVSGGVSGGVGGGGTAVAGPGPGGSVALGPYPGSGRCYAILDTLKRAIYGEVVLACVVTVETVAPNSNTAAAAAAAAGGGGGGGGCGEAGGGGDAAAASVVLRMSNERVAIKCISKASVLRMQQRGGPMNENPLKEVRCLSFLTRRMSGWLAGPEVIRGDPARVLPMVDCVEDRDHIFLVMPCLNQEVFDVVEERGGAFPEQGAAEMLAQILGGLEVAHSLGLAHHDMSLENLMTDTQGGCVIIDWGMVVKVPLTDRGRAVKIASKASWPCRCGKLLYLAPEILSATEASEAFDPFKLDVWACGIMLFILLTGVPPWSVETGPLPSDARFQHVCRGDLHVLLNAWGITLSEDAVALLQSLLWGDPNRRPSLPEIRASPWYRRLLG